MGSSIDSDQNQIEIKRWSTYLIDLNPRLGTKPGKIRPCVVIQDDSLNAIKHPSTVILPITSKNVTKDAFPLRVFLPKEEAGLEVDSMILVDQFLAWDNERFKKHLGSLSSNKQEELELACKEFFGW